MEEGDIASFFVQDLLIGLTLVAKTCPHQPQAFKKVNNGQAFPQEENTLFSFLSKRVGSRYPKAPLLVFSATIPRVDCVGSIPSKKNAPKIDPALKLK